MRALRRIVALAALITGAWVLQVSPVFAYTGTMVPGAGINGTVHDLGTPGDNGMSYGAVPADPQTRICIFCHTPHNAYRLASSGPGGGLVAPAAYDYLPLWNHTLEANTAFLMYDNGPGAPILGWQASQAILVATMTPGSTSLLCLSCHDGSIAVNSWGNSPPNNQSTGSALMSPAYQIGTSHNLTNHHPIGFSYDAVQAQDLYVRTSDVLLIGDEPINQHLYNGNLECGSCHSVHNTGNAGEHLLWRSDQNSELCLTCHAKGLYTPPPAAPPPPA